MQYINVCLFELKFIIDVIQNIGIISQPNKNEQYKQTFIIQQICNNHCILYNTHTKHFLFVNWKDFFFVETGKYDRYIPSLKNGKW